MTAFSSRLHNNMFMTWSLVSPTVETPSTWCIRSPGARKSALGSSKLIVSIIGGYETSTRSRPEKKKSGWKLASKIFYVAKSVTNFYSPARLIHGWQRNVHEEENVVSEDHKLSCEFFSGSAFLSRLANGGKTKKNFFFAIGNKL